MVCVCVCAENYRKGQAEHIDLCARLCGWVNQHRGQSIVLDLVVSGSVFGLSLSLYTVMLLLFPHRKQKIYNLCRGYLCSFIGALEHA